jgi:hypothetical protein
MRVSFIRSILPEKKKRKAACNLNRNVQYKDFDHNVSRPHASKQSVKVNFGVSGVLALNPGQHLTFAVDLVKP